MPPILPPDLISLVVAEITARTHSEIIPKEERVEAIATLASCALVSQLWKECTQPHQFKHFTYVLKEKEPYVPFPDYEDPPWLWKSFRQFVANSPHIMKYVIKFEIKMTEASEYKYFYPDWPLDLEEVIKLLHHFPNLSSLHLLTAALTKPHIPTISQFCGTHGVFVRAVVLGDEDTLFPQSSDILSYMIPFSDSHELVVSAGAFSGLNSESSEPFDLPHFPSLGRLSLLRIYGIKNQSHFLRRAVFSGRFPVLHTLELSASDIQDDDDLRMVLHDLGRQLAHLVVAFDSHNLSHYTPRKALPPPPALRQLQTLRFSASRHDGGATDAWCCFASFIPSPPPPSVEEVIFACPVAPERWEDLDHEQLGQVERRLLGLPGLKQVRFKTYAGENVSLDVPRQKIGDLFPRLQERCRLAVV